ncbi:hypothetical protein FZH89_23195, partial [Cronobacter sakazakii]
MKFKKLFNTAVISALAVSSSAFAAEGSTGFNIDFSALSNNIDFSGVITGLLTIADGVIGIFLAIAGI